MKTPEEIKKGLEIAANGCMTCDCCITDCPYGLECHPMNEDTNVDMPTQLADDAIAYIQQLEAQIPKWISVDERLPEKAGKYLVYEMGFNKGKGYMSVCYFSHCYKGAEEHLNGKCLWYVYDSEYGDCENEGVTHWMPLPEAPKEDT